MSMYVRKNTVNIRWSPIWGLKAFTDSLDVYPVDKRHDSVSNKSQTSQHRVLKGHNDSIYKKFKNFTSQKRITFGGTSLHAETWGKPYTQNSGERKGNIILGAGQDFKVLIVGAQMFIIILATHTCYVFYMYYVSYYIFRNNIIQIQGKYFNTKQIAPRFHPVSYS